jgi:hypothetical protein
MYVRHGNSGSLDFLEGNKSYFTGHLRDVYYLQEVLIYGTSTVHLITGLMAFPMFSMKFLWERKNPIQVKRNRTSFGYKQFLWRVVVPSNDGQKPANY